jgi:N6-L-threonylcarbamoyladenine synthase
MAKSRAKKSDANREQASLRILAIESSCDETGVALIEDGRVIRANVVASQASIHAQYGGVVPEVASRHQLEAIIPVLETAFAEAGVGWEAVDAIAATYGPGLAGSLLVGLTAGKTLALARGLPFIGVNHLEAHIYANWLRTTDHERSDPAFPLLALVVSGAHSELVYIAEHGHYELLGQTRDDAAGEAFDKVAKLLGLGYPGGPLVDRLARGANDSAVAFAVAKMSDGRPDFSFSGLKTAVLYHVRREGIPKVTDPENVSVEVRDLLASFQRALVTALLRGLTRAAKEHRPKSLLLTGGVAANSLLRAEAARAASALGLPFFVPPMDLTTDNAAMIAAAGYVAFRKGVRAGLGLNAEANLKLG